MLAGDFINVGITVTLLLIEHVLRFFARCVVFFLPNFILDVLNRLVKNMSEFLFGYLSNEKQSFGSKQIRRELRDMDATNLILANGFLPEEHVVYTSDGYILSLFRVVSRTTKANQRNEFHSQMPVLLMHGLLECCEVWLCRSSNDSLAYVLCEQGFDVWVGNVRGSKYGFKHRTLHSGSKEFWNFSMDEMISLDLPAMIEYILKTTNRKRLHYIGFSQGSALGFAGFSTNHELAEKISLFIALAPSTRVNGLRIGLINTLVHVDPNLVFLFFGRRVLLRWVIFWRMVLPPELFVKALDYSTHLLFGWTMKNIAPEEKDVLYSHLYSYGSVKVMVHWFQVMVTGRFQMFDDQNGGSYSQRRKYRGHQPPQYPLHQIKVPVALFCGGSDFLPDTKWLLHELNNNNPVHVHIEPSYEHLDFQFARNASSLIYPKVSQLCRARADSPAVEYAN
mmetsp:Transcript_4632/g.8089  ORF Transcript_4632/g.8089 Transcript_4632/m.8089 type:complete len:450 (-) Transcript_4632:28-1377(-)